MEGLGSHGNNVTMPGTVQVAAGRDKGFSPLTILASADDSWNEKETTDFVNSVATFDASKEKKGARSVAIQMTREMGLGVNSANFPFAYQTFKWLCDDRYPIDTPRAHSTDGSLRVGFKAMPYVKWAFLGVLPLLMLLASVLIIIRRKSR